MWVHSPCRSDDFRERPGRWNPLFSSPNVSATASGSFRCTSDGGCARPMLHIALPECNETRPPLVSAAVGVASNRLSNRKDLGRGFTRIQDTATCHPFHSPPTQAGCEPRIRASILTTGDNPRYRHPPGDLPWSPGSSITPKGSGTSSPCDFRLTLTSGTTKFRLFGVQPVPHPDRPVVTGLRRTTTSAKRSLPTT